MRLRRSVAAASLILTVAAGCMPVPGPRMPPAEPAGPILVVAVTNRSDENRFVEYEHQAETAAGGGGGEVSCGSTVMEFGQVSGSYRLMVDDQEVASGQVPRDVGPDAYLVFQIEIAADGSVSVAGPDLLARPPPFRPGVACE